MRDVRTGYVFRNWDSSLSSAPRQFYQPTSEGELLEIVSAVRLAGEKLRVVGAGHSWSPLVLTDQHLLNLDHVNQFIGVDAERQQVTVGAGIRLKELNELLPRHGLALANLGSIAEQSIAGAISTGTHGTGIRYGNLATQIVAMTLVTGNGELIRLSAESDPELMAAARVSLGALGVITQVTIQCVKTYNLLLHAEPLPFAEVLSSIEELNAKNDRVRLYWFTGTDVIYVMTLNQTAEPVSPRQPIIEWFDNVVLRHDLMAMLLWSGNRLPELVDQINRFQARVGFHKEDRIARSDRNLTIPMPPRHQEMEYAVPVEKTVEAIRRTRGIVETYHYKANVPVEVRFVAADENMLSPAYSRAVTYIGAYTYGPELARRYFEGFEHEMKQLGGRPHWGKRLSLTADEVRRMYPLADRFNEIRKQMDPNGMFANPFISDLFGN